MFTVTLAVVPETKDASIPDEPPTRGDINTNYILAGGGILIVLFLCVLSLQIYTCKRAKSTKIQFCEHNASREMRLPDESVNDVQKENSPPPQRIIEPEKTQTFINQQNLLITILTSLWNWNSRQFYQMHPKSTKDQVKSC